MNELIFLTGLVIVFFTLFADAWFMDREDAAKK